MTKLQKILKKKNISTYRLVKMMSLNPLYLQGTWAKKINGTRQLNSLDKSLLQKVLKQLYISKKDFEIIKEDVIYRIK